MYLQWISDTQHFTQVGPTKSTLLPGVYVAMRYPMTNVNVRRQM